MLTHGGFDALQITRRLLLTSALLRADSALAQVEVYRSGQDGYFSYRIPSLLVTKRGTLLAFCEDRKNPVMTRAISTCLSSGAPMTAAPGVRRKWLRIAAPTRLGIPVRLWIGSARSGWR
jgi:hypothetical protein